MKKILISLVLTVGLMAQLSVNGGLVLNSDITLFGGGASYEFMEVSDIMISGDAGVYFGSEDVGPTSASYMSFDIGATARMELADNIYGVGGAVISFFNTTIDAYSIGGFDIPEADDSTTEFTLLIGAEYKMDKIGIQATYGLLSDIDGLRLKVSYDL